MIESMKKSSKSAPLTPEEKNIIHAMKHDLVEMGIVDVKEQMYYIQQELTIRREKDKHKPKMKKGGIYGIIEQIRAKIETILGKTIFKDEIIQGKDHLIENGDFFESMLKDMETEDSNDVFNSITFLDDPSKLKKKTIDFDDLDDI